MSFQFNSAPILEDSKLHSKAPSTTYYRVKQYLMTNPCRQHGSPAETKYAPAFYTHRPKPRAAKPNQGQKLYSKVLTIEPNC